MRQPRYRFHLRRLQAPWDDDRDKATIVVVAESEDGAKAKALAISTEPRKHEAYPSWSFQLIEAEEIEDES